MFQPRFTARWISVEDLLVRRTEWTRLSLESLEANPFYSPDLLAPAIALQAARGRVSLLIVEDQFKRLVALFPLQRPALRNGLFGLAWSLYRDPLTALTTPLVDRGASSAVIHATLDCLLKSAGLLVFSMARTNGAFSTLLQTEVKRRGWRITEMTGYSRPILTHAGAAEGIRTPKSLQRRQRLLAAKESTEIVRIFGDDPRARAFFAKFVALEASGWKAGAGTSLAQNPQLRGIFEGLLNPGRPTVPRILMEGLVSGDRALAMTVNLIVGRAGYTIKSAYDESYAKFSPGRLLDVATSELCAPGGPLDWFDSCAGPGHPLSELWPERDEFASLAIAMSPAGQLWMPVLEGMQAGLHAVRRWRYNENYTTRKTAQSR